MSDEPILLVSVWLREGDVIAFESFEQKIAAIQAKHGGRIERAIRSSGGQTGEQPFETHIVRFPDAASLTAYRNDPDMRSLAGEREEIILRTAIIEGRDVPPYEP